MKTDESILEELRALLPEYMAHKRIVVGSRGKRLIHCINPEHRDETPSMSYHPQSKRLHCFGCGASYDLFDLIGMDYPECSSFPLQVKKACKIFGIPYPRDVQQPCQKAAAPVQDSYADTQGCDYTKQMQQELLRNGVGGAYFEERGISQALCEKYGLFQDTQRAYLPLWSDGKCTCYIGRALRDEIQPRYKNSAGPMGIFNASYLNGEGEGGALFITESIFDALSAEECGFHAVALCGAGNVRRFLALCEQNPAAANRYEWIAAGDADEAGARMNAALKEGLAALGISCAEVCLPQGVKDFNELLTRSREELSACLAAAVQGRAAAYEEKSAAACLGELLDPAQRAGIRRAVATGYTELDRVLDGGLYAGLYVIGAVSSLGKTTFVLQMADYIASQGNDVLFFSLEMSRLELMSKSISRLSWQMDPSARHETAFTSRQVLRGDIPDSPQAQALFRDALETYRDGAGQLFLREGVADIGVGEIREAVSAHVRLRGRRPVVIVDYLQILRPSDAHASDKQNTDRAVVALKRISRDFDVPVVAVSSFNRENYRAAVSMEAFKESGAVEYSSDVLLGLQFSGAGEPGFDINAARAKTPRDVEAVLLKNRSGIPWARIALRYNARYSYFSLRKENPLSASR